MEIINFHVVVSKKTLDYFKYQVSNALYASAIPERIFFYCYALDDYTYQLFNGSPNVIKTMPVFKETWAYRKKTFGEWRTFLIWMFLRRPKLIGSNGHAAGLAGVARTIPHISGHHIIADSDTVMLRNSWDTEICSLLERYDLVGAPYEPIGGFSSGNAKVQTYKNFPTAVWVALRRGIAWEQVSWWPAKEKNIPIDTQELSEIYNLPMGYQVVRDVGWHLCRFAHDKGLKSAVFQHVKPTSGNVRVLNTNNDYNEEYQWRGQAWVGHQRGSSRNPFRRTNMSMVFFQAVEAAIGVPKALDWPVSSSLKGWRRMLRFFRGRS